MTELEVAFTLNGRRCEVRTPPHRTLLDLLREDAGAVEVKEGCGEGVCGACAVLLDGEPVSSCLVLAPRAAGREITTVRGGGGADEFRFLREAFVVQGAVQCGFCTPGMILAAHAFLLERPAPTREEIRAAISGNLCRCTGYAKIIDAIAAAAAMASAAGGSGG
jgi:aerobic-type carbon monoxide dehydrogenase small subunit (CoxS/CutS family)